MPKPNFRSTWNTGFQITFSNGFTISVQFGNRDYCQNKDKRDLEQEGCIDCPNAEVAIWDRNDKVIVPNKYLGKDDGQGCIGWLSPDEVAKIIHWVHGLKE